MITVWVYAECGWSLTVSHLSKLVNIVAFNFLNAVFIVVFLFFSDCQLILRQMVTSVTRHMF